MQSLNGGYVTFEAQAFKAAAFGNEKGFDRVLT